MICCWNLGDLYYEFLKAFCFMGQFHNRFLQLRIHRELKDLRLTMTVLRDMLRASE
jgi:hypothetical protein